MLVQLYMTSYPSFVVELLVYAPPRSIVHPSVAFLWVMTVATVALAAVWSEFAASKENVEQYDELQPKVPIVSPSFHLEILFIQQSIFISLHVLIAWSCSIN